MNIIRCSYWLFVQVTCAWKKAQEKIVGQCVVVVNYYNYFFVVISPNQVACRIFHNLKLKSIVGVVVIYPTLGHPWRPRGQSVGVRESQNDGEKYQEKPSLQCFLRRFFSLSLQLFLTASDLPWVSEDDHGAGTVYNVILFLLPGNYPNN